MARRASHKRWPQVYSGPDIIASAGKVGIAKGTRGKIVKGGQTAVDEEGNELVEFMPHWGQDFITVMLPRNQIFDRGPAELENLL